MNRRQHQPEVIKFLQKQFPGETWECRLPEGSGNETYFASSHVRTCFVKLGAQVDRYQALAGTGLTPEVLASGWLEDGTTILVQAFIPGRIPTRKDYRDNLELFADAIARVHASPMLKQILPGTGSELFRLCGLEALACLREKWERYKAAVPETAGFIDESLDRLGQAVNEFQGGGLVASHNDLCNANWLIGPQGKVNLMDLESMQMDDPAVDIGATLWWYYPPSLRQRFLQRVGHANDPAFEVRMRLRMTMHCLSILLPRAHSFDRFDPAGFSESLADFRASLAGQENPQGYDWDES